MNVNSGARLTTYVIVSEEPGVCVLNGGAARFAEVGDPLLVMAFAHSPEPVQPKIVLVDENNRIKPPPSERNRRCG